MHGRVAPLRMVEDAERGAFVEHIDRLARNAADTIRLREEMEFQGIEIHTGPRDS
jgi:DNA invertase Pin-like site-specific DNA recombinase